MSINKFALLCQKNWIKAKRHPIATIFELVFPIIFTLIWLIIFKNQAGNVNVTLEPSHTSNIMLSPCNINSRNITELFYYPNNKFTNNFMDSVSERFSFNFKAVENAEELDEMLSIKNQSATAVGVVFEDANSTTHPPVCLKYTIKMPDNGNSWNVDKLYHKRLSSSLGNDAEPKESFYFSSCFIKLQNEIDQAFIKIVSNRSKVQKLKTLKSFPIKIVEIEPFVVKCADYLILLLFVMSLVFPVYVLVQNITTERESRLTESMKIMGLSSALYWPSWFMRSFIILLISFTINLILTITSLVSKLPMFANSNPFIIWIFFMSYITSMITFCFLVSVIFMKSSRAVIVRLIVFIATVIPYIMYHDSFYRFGYGLKVLFCMLTNTNMGQGIKMILMAEVNDGGVGFGNLFKRSVDMKFSFAEFLLWMNIGSALQMFLTICNDKTYPKPWSSTLFKRFTQKLTEDSFTMEMKQLLPSENREEEPNNLNISIGIENLSKTIDNDFIVKNMSLNLYENQITVLLGLKGAGKTTVVSMLTGLHQPTSGTAIINGYDINTHINETRSSIGVCTHHNLLFKELTVQESLKFFCEFKGISNENEIQSCIFKYVQKLFLSEKLTSQVMDLNTSERMKLSVAIALCGDSKVVILDEPTSGMDPSSRKQLWDLLKAEKQNRTILVMTSSADEADVLGDRIAIMSKGQLHAVGSPNFIRKTFKIGYRLICVKNAEFNAHYVLRNIQQYAPTAYIDKNETITAVFIIPEEYLPVYGQIFETLETSKEALNIYDFDCSCTSLEDVLYRMDADQIVGFDEEFQAIKAIPDKVIIDTDQESTKEWQKNDKIFTFFQQIYAMILKKFYILCRSWPILFILGFISILILLLIHSLMDTEPSQHTKLLISFDSYGDTETLVNYEQISTSSAKYATLFSGKNKMVNISTEIDQEIEARHSKSSGTVNHKNLIASTFNTNGIIAWYNTQHYHSMPLTVNTVNRAILKSVAGDDYDIKVTNHPYKLSKTDIRDRSTLSFIVWCLLIFWPLYYIGNYIEEQESKFKLMQFLCGTNRLVYWFTNLIFDFTVFILICSVLIGGLVWLNFEKEQRLEEFGVLMTVGSSYGFSWICFIYAFSYLFRKPSAGRLWVLILSIIFSILSDFDYKLVSSEIRLIDYSKLQEYIVINILSGCMFFLLVILHDYNLFRYVYYKLRTSNQTSIDLQEFDEDILVENQVVDSMSNEVIKESNLVIRKLAKSYKNASVISQLSLNVNKHECFGLLGINGTGKTTTFKMMTGDEFITSGDIWIKGKCLKTQLLDAHQFIGYCPQFDNCIPELTGRETLKIFALIRGIKMDEISELINQMSSELDFKQHLDKQVRAYSGGNRRKLSTALALLGNPELIFLDECTTGVDPHARRQIWNAIKRIRDNHRLSSSIVITSHSMDECEALCTRIGIMVAGQFQCLGPVQHLKNKFSKGFVLTIKTGFMDEDKMRELRENVIRKFLDVELKGRQLDVLWFHLTVSGSKYSEVFIKLAEIKEETKIEDYKLTQMSLEQVFINIKKQETPYTQQELVQIAKEEQKWKEKEETDREAREKLKHQLSIETSAMINQLVDDQIRLSREMLDIYGYEYIE